MTTATLSREEMGNATGLFNMLRNIGGSIGIAMATTAIIRRAALHQTEIGANLAGSSMILQQKTRAMALYLSHELGPASARPGSMGLVYQLMEQQSALMAYVDVFRWTALLAFFCALAVWLFRKPPAHAKAPEGVH
jgi:DHA2 family multidrug resistance protein